MVRPPLADGCRAGLGAESNPPHRAEMRIGTGTRHRLRPPGARLPSHGRGDAEGDPGASRERGLVGSALLEDKLGEGPARDDTELDVAGKEVLSGVSQSDDIDGPPV